MHSVLMLQTCIIGACDSPQYIQLPFCVNEKIHVFSVHGLLWYMQTEPHIFEGIHSHIPKLYVHGKCTHVWDIHTLEKHVTCSLFFILLQKGQAGIDGFLYLISSSASGCKKYVPLFPSTVAQIPGIQDRPAALVVTVLIYPPTPKTRPEVPFPLTSSLPPH